MENNINADGVRLRRGADGHIRYSKYEDVDSDLGKKCLTVIRIIPTI